MNENTYSILPTLILQDKSISFAAKVLLGNLKSLMNKYGYCFAKNKYLSEIMGISTRQITHLLSILKKKRIIIVEIEKEKGNYRKIWTPDTYAYKDYSSKIEEKEETKTWNREEFNQRFYSMEENFHRYRSRLPYSNSINDNVYIKGVVGNGIAKLPPKKKEPPVLPLYKSYEKNEEKERMSDKDRDKLVEIYGAKLVDKKSKNVLNTKIKARKSGNADKEYYNRDFADILREYCEDELKRKRDSEEKKKAKDEGFETEEEYEVVKKRRLLVDSNEIIKKYCKIDDGGILVDIKKVGNEFFYSKGVRGIPFKETNFDSMYKKLIKELSSLERAS